MIRRPPRSTRTDTLFSLHDALPISLHVKTKADRFGAQFLGWPFTKQRREAGRPAAPEPVKHGVAGFGMGGDIEGNRLRGNLCRVGKGPVQCTGALCRQWLAVEGIQRFGGHRRRCLAWPVCCVKHLRSEEHTSELQSLMLIS